MVEKKKAKVAKKKADEEPGEGAESEGLSERAGMSEPMTREQIDAENAPSTER